MLSVDLIMPVTENPSFEMIPDYSKTDFVEIKLKLEDVDWQTELQNKDTLDTWKLIQDKIFSVVDSCIPKKRRRINNKPLWMNRNIMITIRKKRRLWKWFCNTHDGKDYNAYTKTRDEVNKAIKKAKRNLEKRLAKDAKSNPKPFYQYMAKQTKCHTRVGPLKDKNGKIQNKDEGQLYTNQDTRYTDSQTDAARLPDVQTVSTNLPDSQTVSTKLPDRQT